MTCSNANPITSRHQSLTPLPKTLQAFPRLLHKKQNQPRGPVSSAPTYLSAQSGVEYPLLQPQGAFSLLPDGSPYAFSHFKAFATAGLSSWYAPPL